MMLGKVDFNKHVNSTGVMLNGNDQHDFASIIAL